jgi:hypothetical protein
MEAGSDESEWFADVHELAKRSQNPISNLVSLPFQYNIEFGTGTRNKDRHTLNIEPVMPVELNSNWNLISRLIVPLPESFPEIAPMTGRQTGIGDLSYSAFFSPNTTGSFTWGFGPVIVIPMVTDSPLGSGKWSIGPTAVGLGIKGHWVVGALVSNVWSFAGDDSRPDVNTMVLQPFVNYNMKDGWYLTSSPIMTANWEASSGEKWTVPLGGGFGRVFHVGDQAMNFSFQGFGYAQEPTGGPDWSLRLQLSFLFPK